MDVDFTVPLVEQLAVGGEAVRLAGPARQLARVSDLKGRLSAAAEPRRDGGSFAQQAANEPDGSFATALGGTLLMQSSESDPAAISTYLLDEQPTVNLVFEVEVTATVEQLVDGGYTAVQSAAHAIDAFLDAISTAQLLEVIRGAGFPYVQFERTTTASAHSVPPTAPPLTPSPPPASPQAVDVMDWPRIVWYVVAVAAGCLVGFGLCVCGLDHRARAWMRERLLPLTRVAAAASARREQRRLHDAKLAHDVAAREAATLGTDGRLRSAGGELLGERYAKAMAQAASRHAAASEGTDEPTSRSSSRRSGSRHPPSAGIGASAEPSERSSCAVTATDEPASARPLGSCRSLSLRSRLGWGGGGAAAAAGDGGDLGGDLGGEGAGAAAAAAAAATAGSERTRRLLMSRGRQEGGAAAEARLREWVRRSFGCDKLEAFVGGDKLEAFGGDKLEQEDEMGVAAGEAAVDKRRRGRRTGGAKSRQARDDRARSPTRQRESDGHLPREGGHAQSSQVGLGQVKSRHERRPRHARAQRRGASPQGRRTPSRAARLSDAAMPTKARHPDPSAQGRPLGDLGAELGAELGPELGELIPAALRQLARKDGPRGHGAKGRQLALKDVRDERLLQLAASSQGRYSTPAKLLGPQHSTDEGDRPQLTRGIAAGMPSKAAPGRVSLRRGGQPASPSSPLGHASTPNAKSGHASTPKAKSPHAISPRAKSPHARSPTAKVALAKAAHAKSAAAQLASWSAAQAELVVEDRLRMTRWLMEAGLGEAERVSTADLLERARVTSVDQLRERWDGFAHA